MVRQRSEAFTSFLYLPLMKLPRGDHRLEAIASRLEASASRLEAIAIKLEAMASGLDAIASRLDGHCY